MGFCFTSKDNGTSSQPQRFNSLGQVYVFGDFDERILVVATI